MSKLPENLFTILEFSDTDSGRIYRGEKAIHSFEEGGLIAFEAALDELEQDVQKLYLVASTPQSSLAFDSDWETRTLSDVLTAAADNGADIRFHRESPSMAAQAAVPTVIYFGLVPSLASILTDAKFAEVLEKYGYSLADEEGEPIDYSQVASDSVWVYDPVTKTGLAVIHSGLIESSLTSPGFASILRVMDDFVKKNDDRRLFLTEEPFLCEVYQDSEEFNWNFDLESGQYLEPVAE